MASDLVVQSLISYTKTWTQTSFVPEFGNVIPEFGNVVERIRSRCWVTVEMLGDGRERCWYAPLQSAYFLPKTFVETLTYGSVKPSYPCRLPIFRRSKRHTVSTNTLYLRFTSLLQSSAIFHRTAPWSTASGIAVTALLCMLEPPLQP